MRYINLTGCIAIPLAFLVHWLFKAHGWEPTATFLLAGAGIIPLANMMGRATEHLSEKIGPTWGGLLNATFGNAAELIIGIIGLSKGLNEIIKASLTGSILGNLLLVAGASMVAGGWNREKQVLNAKTAETNAGLLAIAVAGMLIPAIFHYSYKNTDPNLYQHEQGVSVCTSIVLLLIYALGLFFTLKTHAHVFSTRPAANEEEPAGVGALDSGGWTLKFSVMILVLASVGVAFVAELLVGSAESMAHGLHFNDVFVGVILLAIIGNAAEHSTALMLARRNDMDTAMSITYQSSIQIALFVVPALVLLSAFMHATGMGFAHGVTEHVALNLVFTPMEVVAVLLSVGIVIVLAMNGETNWLEGALLLGLYVILAIAFFYIPIGVGRR